MDPHCFDADPDPDPAQNLDADPDPDPDPGGGEGVGQLRMCIPPDKILGTPLGTRYPWMINWIPLIVLKLPYLYQLYVSSQRDREYK